MDGNELPREMLVRQGAKQMPLAGLLAVLLQSGTRKESVFELAARLAEDFGDRTLAGCNGVKEAERSFGLSRGKACQLVSALELGRRLYDPGSREFPRLQGPEEAAQYLEPMGRQMREVFRCLYLDTSNRLIRDEVISVGSLNSSLVHPREVFHFALQYSAASLLLAHNHPSGSLRPSEEDQSLTRQLVKTGHVMGIPVLDHLIISREGWFSFREHGLMPERQT